MDINGISGSKDNSINHSAAALAAPSADSTRAFQQVMQGQSADNSTDCCAKKAADDQQPQGKDAKMEEVLEMLQQLIQQLLQSLKEDNKKTADTNDKTANDKPSSAKPSQGSDAANGANGGVQAGGNGAEGSSSAANDKIPPATEHIQQLNLGGKPVSVGGDGTASAEEVFATAANIQHLYDNNPAFKEMIDKSGDNQLEITVGRNTENSSWDSDNGRVFLNMNQVAPSNSNTYQDLFAQGNSIKDTAAR